MGPGPAQDFERSIRQHISVPCFETQRHWHGFAVVPASPHLPHERLIGPEGSVVTFTRFQGNRVESIVCDSDACTRINHCKQSISGIIDVNRPHIGHHDIAIPAAVFHEIPEFEGMPVRLLGGAVFEGAVLD